MIAEDTIHRKMTEDIAGILKHRFQADTSVAVWSNDEAKTPVELLLVGT